MPMLPTIPTCARGSDMLSTISCAVCYYAPFFYFVEQFLDVLVADLKVPTPALRAFLISHNLPPFDEWVISSEICMY